MKRLAITVAAVAVMSAGFEASAQFSDSFEGYAAGDVLHHVNAWKGWNDVSGSAGVVSNDRAYDGSNSIRIHGYMDAVREFSGVNADTWTLDAKQYIADGQTGLSYFIVMNRYADNGNTDSGMWSVQLRFDLAGGRVYDDFRGGSVPIVTNQWADIRVVVNLEEDSVQSYYDDTMISSGSWTRSGSSAREIAALDLYSAQSNTVSYDAVTLVPTTGTVSIAAMGLVVLVPRQRRKGRASA